MLRKIGYFLCLIDEQPRISLSNVAFMIIMGKIIESPQVDWTALVTLAITCANMMHDRNATPPQAVQELTDKLTNLESKVSSVLKGNLT